MTFSYQTYEFLVFSVFVGCTICTRVPKISIAPRVVDETSFLVCRGSIGSITASKENSFEEVVTKKVELGLSPLPVIVEMKVYRDSLLKM